MISIKSIDILKELASVQADIMPGVIFAIAEGDVLTWVVSSKDITSKIFYEGQKLGQDSTTVLAQKKNKTITRKVPRSVYGIRFTITSIPIVDDNGAANVSFSMVFLWKHVILSSFGDFAPILSRAFQEGVFMYVTGLKEVLVTQGSEKFNVSSINVGDKIPDKSISKEVIRTKKGMSQEFDTSKYGVPVMVECNPLFDEDEVVGTFSIITPREAAVNLRELSGDLSQGISGISSAIQELAASASEIHLNEQNLNNEIKQVIGLSEEINEVSSFIKDIADETKMLGLNAAIEAARAGEVGKGFGVVAQEIRNLSDQSKGTVPKIKELTDNIKSKIDESSKKSQSSLSSSQEQAAATEEVTASIEEITKMAEDLNKIAQKL
ncbi:methyl-accepting chemotaxis protein [Clostridium fermenticellae]|uniref:Methyl-accepting chemotaxis protein n=1 Tax=Clostridium fermenticellae TaxID=2068654 RepID=A0A386H468_9CLOT|nr:methyl-accepting chemotaxis protein [Clostridium fermenticellae]AYD40517.1 methyl-accepting chemotaxis protein [Clostridium fermenticellae]